MFVTVLLSPSLTHSTFHTKRIACMSISPVFSSFHSTASSHSHSVMCHRHRSNTCTISAIVHDICHNAANKFQMRTNTTRLIPITQPNVFSLVFCNVTHGEVFRDALIHIISFLSVDYFIAFVRMSDFFSITFFPPQCRKLLLDKSSAFDNTLHWAA